MINFMLVRLLSLAVAGALLFPAAAAAQNIYQFSTPFIFTQGVSDPDGNAFSNGCDTPCPPGTFGFNVFSNGNRQNGKVSITGPASATGTLLPDATVKLGPASFQIAWSNIGAFNSVQILNLGDPGAGSCTVGGGGGACSTNGLISTAYNRSNNTFQIALNMSVVVNANYAGRISTVAIKVTWFWQITGAQPPDLDRPRPPTDSRFVVEAGPGLKTACKKRSDGPLLITVPVTRVIGDVDSNNFPVAPRPGTVVSTNVTLRVAVYHSGLAGSTAVPQDRFKMNEKIPISTAHPRSSPATTANGR